MSAPVPPEAQRRHDEAVARGESTYLDPATGYVVFTSAELEGRGYCCRNGCRHCPWDHVGPTRSERGGPDQR